MLLVIIIINFLLCSVFIQKLCIFLHISLCFVSFYIFPSHSILLCFCHILSKKAGRGIGEEGRKARNRTSKVFLLNKTHSLYQRQRMRRKKNRQTVDQKERETDRQQMRREKDRETADKKEIKTDRQRMRREKNRQTALDEKRERQKDST